MSVNCSGRFALMLEFVVRTNLLKIPQSRHGKLPDFRAFDGGEGDHRLVDGPLSVSVVLMLWHSCIR